MTVVVVTPELLVVTDDRTLAGHPPESDGCGDLTVVEPFSWTSPLVAVPRPASVAAFTAEEGVLNVDGMGGTGGGVQLPAVLGDFRLSSGERGLDDVRLPGLAGSGEEVWPKVV